MAAMGGAMLARVQKELRMLEMDPPPGVSAWSMAEDELTHLQAHIQGPEDTPYSAGTFLLDVQVPARYPFEPPQVRFLTPIFHPNIDSGGRICLDTLKMRPAGSWTPSINIPTLLTTIRLLMAHPNGDDGLMPDITELFLNNPRRFEEMATQHTRQHAVQDTKMTADEAPASAVGDTATVATAGAREGELRDAEVSTPSKPRDGVKVEAGVEASATLTATTAAAAAGTSGRGGGGQSGTSSAGEEANSKKTERRENKDSGGDDDARSNSSEGSSSEGSSEGSSDESSESEEEEDEDGEDGAKSKKQRVS